MTTKRKRPQAQKSRSIETRDLILSRRGGKQDRIPSATAYKREKSFSRVDMSRYSD